MNLFGKFLTVFILVLSIVFMGFAMMVYSTHKNWRQAVEDPNTGLKVKLRNSQTQNQNLQAQLDQLQKDLDTERAERQRRVANLETERENLRRERDERIQEHAALVEENRRLIAETASVQNNMRTQLDELNALRENIRTVQTEKEQNFQQAVKLTDELNQSLGQLETLKNRNVQLTQQTAKLLAILDARDINPNDPVDGTPPKVDGLVVAVNNQGLVELSIGADDGIRRGHKLDVYRNNANTSKYLGRVEVITTQPDKSVAKILPEFRRGLIQKEDRVATRLN